MKIFFILGILSLMFFVLSGGINPCHAEVPCDDNDSGNSFAVVELFTSEGCSSCPPADKLLGEIVASARANNKPIFALSFHIDYWDYIGWKDPYGNKAFSERQQMYAQVFRSNRIYTPQMIVNGTEEFVGSNRQKARANIRSALGKSAEVTLLLKKIENGQSNQLSVGYNLSELPGDTVLNLALVERGLVTDIKRGENSGKKLDHENVVRSFNASKLNKQTGSSTLVLPASVNLDNCSIIGYVQQVSTMKILAASGLEL